jgi:hypothetical protein
MLQVMGCVVGIVMLIVFAVNLPRQIAIRTVQNHVTMVVMMVAIVLDVSRFMGGGNRRDRSQCANDGQAAKEFARQHM